MSNVYKIGSPALVTPDGTVHWIDVDVEPIGPSRVVLTATEKGSGRELGKVSMTVAWLEIWMKQWHDSH